MLSTYPDDPAAEAAAEKMLDIALSACHEIDIEHEMRMELCAKRLMNKSTPLDDLELLFASSSKADVANFLRRCIEMRGEKNSNRLVVEAIRDYFTNRLITQIAEEAKMKNNTKKGHRITTHDSRWEAVSNIVTFFRGQSETLVL